MRDLSLKPAVKPRRSVLAWTLLIIATMIALVSLSFGAYEADRYSVNKLKFDTSPNVTPR